MKFKKLIAVITVAAVALSISACKKESKSESFDQLEPPAKGEEIAIVHTNLGDMQIKFFPELAPKAVENFVTHSKNGYYDGVSFHRVINEFMIQGGDPEGTGAGGESIWGEPFGLEVTPKLHHIRGALSTAKTSEPVSIGSQFFIVHRTKLAESTAAWLQNLKANPDETFHDAYGQIHKNDNGSDMTNKEAMPEQFIEKYDADGGYPELDYSYTVFGQVFDGFDVLDKIATVETDAYDKPLEDVIINSIEIMNYEE
jgi:peptidyl-prolyl cis-trans isomerase B (cyclophilin B)